MCIDLAAKHFSQLSQEAVISSQNPFQFDDGFGLRWLFLDRASTFTAQDSGSESESVLSRISDVVEASRWTINGYSKDILSLSPIANKLRSGQAQLNMLYVMELDPKRLKNPISSTTPHSIQITDGKNWFKSAHPDKIHMLKHETVWTVTVDTRAASDNINNNNSSSASEPNCLKVMGHISTLYSPPCPAYPKRPRLYVSDLLVDENLRGQGLGRHLLHHVIQQAKSDPSEPIVTLTVFCENLPAVGLYFKEGFKATEVVWVVSSSSSS